MEPRRFQLDGATLPELKARILAEHGADARIVSAERVTVGGIRGFFARRHYEVVVEVTPRLRRAAHAQPDREARLGILALLDDADGADDAGSLGRQPSDLPTPAVPHLSTDTNGFARLMDELTFSVEPPPGEIEAPAPGRQAGAALSAAAPRAAIAATVPRPLARPGDLVLLVGAPADVLRVAGAMTAMNGAGEVLVAGSVVAEGARHIDDRRSALAARAGGVARGRTCFLAFGLDPGFEDQLPGVGADQVWVVADAGRKAADTAAWVGAVASVLTVDALAVVGVATTGSPESVDGLGLPIGWVDGAPATATTIAATTIPAVFDAHARLG